MKKVADIVDEPWRNPELGMCACSQLRRASRAVTALYDGFLASSGLTVTQYGLLVGIARSQGIGRTELAAKAGMERTTLTRNLHPLEREGLLDEKPGVDARRRVLRLTASGRKRLARSYPLWEAAQRKFVGGLGHHRIEEMRSLLTAASAVSGLGD